MRVEDREVARTQGRLKGQRPGRLWEEQVTQPTRLGGENENTRDVGCDGEGQGASVCWWGTLTRRPERESSEGTSLRSVWDPRGPQDTGWLHCTHLRRPGATREASQRESEAVTKHGGRLLGKCGALSQPSVACCGLPVRPATGHSVQAERDEPTWPEAPVCRRGGLGPGQSTGVRSAGEVDSGGQSVTLSGTCRMRGSCEGTGLGSGPSREGAVGESGQQAHPGAGAGRGCKSMPRVSKGSLS